MTPSDEVLYHIYKVGRTDDRLRHVETVRANIGTLKLHCDRNLQHLQTGDTLHAVVAHSGRVVYSFRVETVTVLEELA